MWGDGVWAIVPIKQAALAKQRLAGALDAGERRALVYAMARDVIDCLDRCENISNIIIVSPDFDLQSLSMPAKAEVLSLAGDDGYNCALEGAARWLKNTRCRAMLVVPADLPAAAPADIERLIAGHKPSPAVTLVPAARDRGTNALMCSPPDVIGFQFGEDSFNRHIAAARTAGIEPHIIAAPSLAHDIDLPGDLARFANRRSNTHTFRYLQTGGLAGRLETMAPTPPGDDPAMRAGAGTRVHP